MVSHPAPAALTTEERNLLYLAVTGHSPAQAADAMRLPLTHTQNVLEGLQRRLGLPSRSSLITQAIVRRWV